MSTQALVEQIKQAGEDFEFYPTTREIVYGVWKRLGSDRYGLNILDIGAGNGNFFRLLEECESKNTGERRHTFHKYAIEKSQILLSNLPADVFVIGTDFRFQTLIDKKMDVIFCNPPYSEFEQWAAKIIREANAKRVFLVLPTRWEKSPVIAQAIKDRGVFASVVGTYDFANAERAARCTVHLISVYYGENLHKNDPFNVWFDNTFHFSAEKADTLGYRAEQAREEQLKAQLVKGQNLIERLEELYTEEMAKLLQNYQAIEGLDAGILKELNVDIDKLREGLRVRLSGTKAMYWKQLFDRLTAITDRLTAKSRKEMLRTLQEHNSVDYTSANAYAVVLWAIKNANKYMETQLKDLYLELSSVENIKNYKSNIRTFTRDDWRFKREEFTHYKLDYRIIENAYNCFESWGGEPRITEGASNRINDVLTVGRTLGFSVNGNANEVAWKPGEAHVFMHTQNGEETPFVRVKAYHNGNIHYQFCKEFSKAFNVEAGRLFGWLRTAQDAARELEIPLTETVYYFGRQQAAKLGASNIKLLA